MSRQIYPIRPRGNSDYPRLLHEWLITHSLEVEDFIKILKSIALSPIDIKTTTPYSTTLLIVCESQTSYLLNLRYSNFTNHTPEIVITDINSEISSVYTFSMDFDSNWKVKLKSTHPADPLTMYSAKSSSLSIQTLANSIGNSASTEEVEPVNRFKKLFKKLFKKP